MDAFVRRLVERLVAEGQPLSRNRHFHTFDTVEGRLALRTARRLMALQRSILRCAASAGGRLELGRGGATAGRAHCLRLASPLGSHTAYLSEDELQVLKALPGVETALDRPATRRAG